MIAPGEGAPDPFEDALIAARLCAIDPGLGGMILRGGGDARDAVIARLHAVLPAGAPLRRLPVHIDDERLLGGIDLAATLASGHAVRSAGLLAEADGGMIVVPMAERMSDATAGRIAGAIDGGARFLVVALDDAIGPDERSAAALGERTAFWVDLSNSSPARGGGPAEGWWRGEAASGSPVAGPLHRSASGPQHRVDHALHGQGSSGVRSDPVLHAGEELMTAIIATAAALGIDSARALLFTLRSARASARLAGRTSVADADVTLAARLVLAPRATRIPMEAEDQQRDAPPPSESDGGEDERGEPGALQDVVLAAALAALPKDVLARIAAGRGRGRKTSRANGAGERRTSAVRGRPLGARPGTPGGGLRLSLIDTLRAAAPWQKLRVASGRVQIRRDDLRVRRFETRSIALTIFAVDASGSSALARLAEAKGAVELLLAEAYVKRAEVALVAFRGTTAELLLPPTRSLARARRSLAELPGGGGTPLAAGLNAARALAESAKARGRTPFVVVLTDGRANISADGTAVRQAAEADATAAARAIGATGIASAFVDISARPRPEGAALAAAMGARYLPLPRADAAMMHAAIRATQPG